MTDFLVSALRAALQASATVLAVYSAVDWQVEEKADKSPLTRADRESHEVISALLTSRHPQVPLLSEEGKALPPETRANWKRLWVVDPLDGTKEFLSRNGEFTINIALVEAGSPVLGVIAVPTLGNYYVALKNRGAWLVREPEASAAVEHTSPLSALDRQASTLPLRRDQRSANGESSAAIRIVASRSHLNAETEQFISAAKDRYDEVNLIQAGSSLKLCRIAEGAADYYPRLAPTWEWDTAAGHIIINEAGGAVYRATPNGHMTDQELTYNKDNLLNPPFIAVGKQVRS